jgi:predicted DNA-binding transcriptional regulator YafY
MFDHVLKASLEDHRVVSIIYLKGIDITERKIKVLDISEDKVKAYCYLRKETRIFKKDNILSAALCNNRTLYANTSKVPIKL